MKFKEIKTTMLLTIIILFLLGTIGCSKDDVGVDNVGVDNVTIDDKKADDSSKSSNEPNNNGSGSAKGQAKQEAKNSKGEVAKIENGKLFVSVNGKDFQEHLIPGAKKLVAIQKGEKPGQFVAEDEDGNIFVSSDSNLQNWKKEQEFAGGDGSQVKPYQIGNAKHVNNIKKYLNKHFILIKDIDLSEFKNFEPIGKEKKPFKGSLDGQDKTIKNLTINRASENNVGLFGYVKEGTIKNLALTNVNVTGKKFVGGLVGTNWVGIIENSYATGTVTGRDDYVGGLVGYNYGTIQKSYATGNVTGSDYVGGLVGSNRETIQKSYATGNVKGKDYNVGGLVGENDGLIEQSYSMGNVTGADNVGGLVGSNEGRIQNSYATGNVTGKEEVGGLVGYNEGRIQNSYAAGDVKGDSDVGGLLGENDDGSIEKSFGKKQDGATNEIKAKTDEELKALTAESAGDWDESIWLFSIGSYPKLKNMPVQN